MHCDDGLQIAFIFLIALNVNILMGYSLVNLLHTHTHNDRGKKVNDNEANTSKEKEHSKKTKEEQKNKNHKERKQWLCVVDAYVVHDFVLTKFLF